MRIPSKRFWQGTVRAAIALSVALTAALVSVAAFFCIAGEALLPRVMLDSLHFSPLWPYFVGAPVALAKSFRPHRALGPATLNARSLVDRRDAACT